MIGSKFKLQEYSDHVKELLREIITDPVFSDVTLIFDDFKTMKANRNILSACSPTLKNILQIDPSKSSHLYLRGLKIAEIEAMIEFVLFGEVIIQQDQINDFLKFAEILEIKELCNRDREQEKTLPIEVKTNENSESTSANADNHETKVEAVWTPDYSCKLCKKDYTGSKWGKESLKIHVRRTHDKIRYPCNKCDFQAGGTSDLNKHIQSIHEGIKFECQYEGCNYKSTRKATVNYHVRFKHEGIYYPCDMCGERFMDPSALKKHVQHKHKNSFVSKIRAIKEEMYLRLSNLSVHHSAAFLFVKST